MPALTPGANCAIPAGPVAVSITGAAALDVSALLCTSTGKVRSDADFIFYNSPIGPGVTYTPAAQSNRNADTVTVDTASLPAEIEKVVVTASLDGTGPATFGAAGTISAIVYDAAGSEVAQFVVPPLTSQTALVCVEIYTRNGAWKVRAVGQGYDNGLAGIATDYGISVDDDPPAPAPGPAPPTPQWSPPPSWAPPPSPTSPPGQAQDAPPPPSPAPAAPPMINLDKGRVSLAKGQSVSLVKTGAPALSAVAMGLGWDASTGRGRSNDLDASCIAFDAAGKDVDKIWFSSKSGCNKSVRHSGDNLTGHGAGDDEVITVDLTNVPASVAALVFTVTSYSGQDFTNVRNAYARLLDTSARPPAELVRYELSDSQPTTGVLMCALRRSGNGSWTMTAIGEFVKGKTVRDMVKPAAAALRLSG